MPSAIQSIACSMRRARVSSFLASAIHSTYSRLQLGAKSSNAAHGHNWENWRDRLRGGLSYLFPGPLWLVYE